MLDEYDWRKSEAIYWVEYGSYHSQVMRINATAKRERREEMGVTTSVFDWLFEALFPKRYWWLNYCHGRLPDMRLFYKDGSPSKLFVKHPLPRLVERQ